MARRSSQEISSEIIARFGFLPPFFGPALRSPAVLENLWQQTISAYLENPIPDLFKEKLTATLARYCAVPYCLVCHSSALRPLGMNAGDVLELLERPAIGFDELAEMIRVLPEGSLSEWPSSGSSTEESILYCCVAIFLYHDTERCQETLRALLGEDYFNHLISFLAYNRTALTWAESHPELSYEADRRVEENLQPLLDSEPRLATFFKEYRARHQDQGDRRTLWLTREAKRLLDQEKSLRTALQCSVQELESERDLRERFVAALTHDLQTPLTTARMNAQLLLRKPQDAAAVKIMASRIIGSIDRGENMVRDLLDANLLKAGSGIPVLPVECCLDEILSDVLAELRMVSEREIALENSAGKIQGHWDGRSLQRVVENLVGNAIKYGRMNSPICLSLSRGPDFVELSVHNKGNPMPFEDQQKIFEGYRRADAAISSGQRGWGIGLMVVKGIVEAHRGSIRVKSDSEGTTFFVQLPLDSRS